jgi:hypothetical protein
MATSIAVLNYFAFFTLYIIGFVFIYQKFSEIIGFTLLAVVNLAFFFFVLNDLMGMLETTRNFVTMVSIFAIIVGSVFHTVVLIFILTMVTDLKIKFEKKNGSSFKLPPRYANSLESIKRLMIASFCLGFIILYNLFYNKKLLEENFVMLLSYIEFNSLSNNTFTKHLTLFFTLAASLSLMALSSKQVFDGDMFNKLPTRYLMIPPDANKKT